MLSGKCTFFPKKYCIFIKCAVQNLAFSVNSVLKLPINCDKVTFLKVTMVWKAKCPLLDHGFLAWGPKMNFKKPKNPDTEHKLVTCLYIFLGKNSIASIRHLKSVHNPKIKNHFSKKGTEKNYRNNHKKRNKMA